MLYEVTDLHTTFGVGKKKHNFYSRDAKAMFWNLLYLEGEDKMYFRIERKRDNHMDKLWTTRLAILEKLLVAMRSNHNPHNDLEKGALREKRTRSTVSKPPNETGRDKEQ